MKKERPLLTKIFAKQKGGSPFRKVLASASSLIPGVGGSIGEFLRTTAPSESGEKYKKLFGDVDNDINYSIDNVAKDIVKQQETTQMKEESKFMIWIKKPINLGLIALGSVVTIFMLMRKKQHNPSNRRSTR